MTAPPRFNPEVFRNLTFYKQFRRTDNVTGNPINLTNNTITGQIWNEEETKKYADFTCTIDDASDGKFSISLTKAQTNILPDKPYYSIVRTLAGQDKTLFKGYLKVKQGYNQ
jgi:hypothetical protein